MLEVCKALLGTSTLGSCSGDGTSLFPDTDLLELLPGMHLSRKINWIMVKVQGVDSQMCQGDPDRSSSNSCHVLRCGDSPPPALNHISSHLPALLAQKNLNLLFLEIKGRSRVAQAFNVGVKCFGNSNRFFLMSLGPCCALQNTSPGTFLDNGLKLQKQLKFCNLVLNLNISNLNCFIFCIYSPSNFSSKFCDEALRQITKIINQLVRLGMKMLVRKGNVEENK